MRLQGKTAIVIGAGQIPGETIGNGRATTIRFAQEGAKVMAVDYNLPSAEETIAMVKKEGGEGFAYEADVTKEAMLAAAIAEAKKRWGRIDILHYNVGVAQNGGDARLLNYTEEIFDRINAINLRGAIMACKHVVPIMREQRAGAIVLISSTAALENYPYIGYKVTKAAMVAFAKQVAIDNAEFGIRANTILPGLIDTPMAVDTRVQKSQSHKTRAMIVAERAAYIPLRHQMGTAWDVANAALFLASDEANFITGVALRVDGGSAIKLD